uniref:RxLR effector protein n=1 Tax=Phytophthora agathidicida TaxID=1642459 RepID=A0A7G4WI26_9STRA|nr:PaRXLR37 [Phytophthora agathidicida]
MRVYQFLLVLSTALMSSGAFATATDSTQEVSKLATHATDSGRFLRNYDSTDEGNVNEVNEERVASSPSWYRKISNFAESLGFTRIADNFLYRAWKDEKMSTKDALVEMKMTGLSPAQMAKRGLDRYSDYSAILAKAGAAQ